MQGLGEHLAELRLLHPEPEADSRAGAERRASGAAKAWIELKEAKTSVGTASL